MQEDLRSFLAKLADHKKLKTVTDPVDITEIPELMHQSSQASVAVICQNIKGFKFPLVNNILGGQDFLALAFNCAREEVVPEYIERCRQPIDPVVIDAAPVQQVVKMYPQDDFDVREFPFVKHSAKDADRYVTAGMVIVKDPETGIRNVLINRMQLKGPHKLGQQCPGHDLCSRVIYWCFGSWDLQYLRWLSGFGVDGFCARNCHDHRFKFLPASHLTYCIIRIGLPVWLGKPRAVGFLPARS